MKVLLPFIILLIATKAIELELSSENNLQACTVLISSFDPINVELKLPAIPDKQPQQQFSIRLSQLLTSEEENFVEMGDNITYRYSYQLQSNIPYQLCVSFTYARYSQKVKPIYVGFTANEDFESLIGQVEVPAELASEQNLKTIYHIAGEMKQVSALIKKHQYKERNLEDEIVTRNVHKQKRIIVLSIIEVSIIVLCGVYQIFALRRFLIQKNLY